MPASRYSRIESSVKPPESIIPIVDSEWGLRSRIVLIEIMDRRNGRAVAG